MASRITSEAILLLFVATLLSLLTPSVFAIDRLNAGQSLLSGQSLAEGPYLFTMQKDCNLVLYDDNAAVWATGTNGRASDCIVTMQRDANLVIYSGNDAIWASNSNRQSGNYYLILQRDRNVVIYDNSNNVIWATGTNTGDAATFVIPHSNGTVDASGVQNRRIKKLYP